MVANLNGVVFGQLYGDNSGGAEFDTDSDGATTQEDEFVSVTNTTGAAIDISGWEIWSDSTGTGAGADPPADGLYHTFPPGTVIAPGDTIYIINEYTGTLPSWAQEASVGGTESPGGGVVTNFLSEGGPNSLADSVALVDPVSGDYIVFNFSTLPEGVSSLPGFPGTTSVGEEDGAAVRNDQNAGSSYQYDDLSNSYSYGPVFVPCFVAGTLIATPDGPRQVEALTTGDKVLTLDHGPQPLRKSLMTRIDFRRGDRDRDRPILIRAGALGGGKPQADLRVSPQHRVLLSQADGPDVLVPAKALLDWPGVRVMRGVRQICYVHLVFDLHQILFAEGAPSESFWSGEYARRMGRIASPIAQSTPARPLLSVGAARSAALRPWADRATTAQFRSVGHSCAPAP